MSQLEAVSASLKCNVHMLMIDSAAEITRGH